MIKRHPVSGTTATIMADDVEAFESQPLHEADLIGRKSPK